MQAVIDPDALAARQFRLGEYGVLRKIVGSRAGIHRNNLGERSDSQFARVRRPRTHPPTAHAPTHATQTVQTQMRDTKCKTTRAHKHTYI